jgi:saccharopine dehydrogenase (NAD+, L-lysine forming)
MPIQDHDLKPTLGLRREDKNHWERRVPLTPDHVRQLVERGVRVRVQPSTIRIFPDDDYRAAGALVDEDLSSCPVIFGVKEIPSAMFREGQAYVYFSHTIKGQAYNMPMLQRLLDLGCNLLDYERMVDARGRRLVFFGRHAGLAGAVETLHALGQRLLLVDGLKTPFAEVKQAWQYASVGEAQQALSAVRAAIDAAGGLPEQLRPLVIGVAGYGNVAQGVDEMLAPLGITRIDPADLADLDARDPRAIYSVTFKEEHLVQPKAADLPFILQEYYDHPERYEGKFAPQLQHLSVLVNAIYWTERYPRLFSLEQLAALYPLDGPQPRLRVIGDITCDIGGSVPCNLGETSPDSPNYVWNPDTGEICDGVAGRGPVVMAVDNLPCEFPADASRSFGDALLPFVEEVATTDWSKGFADLTLPPEILPSLIVHEGELTPDYEYLRASLGAQE